jgi:hypothetical protein
MATYQELHDLGQNSDLLDTVETAVIKAAQGIVGGSASNQGQRDKWAAQAFESPRHIAGKMLPGVLATNSDSSVATILGASDAAFQTNVDDLVDLFADLIA